MTEVIFNHYQLTWKFTDDGNEQAADFWLPAASDPRDYMNDVFNIVELSASEYGYEYKLEKIETRVYRMVG
jgi:hypothetical protein